LRGLESERSSKFPRTSDPERLLIAKLRIRIRPQTWLGVFTLRHPYVLMEVLSRSAVSPKVSVADIWITGQRPGIWGKEIAAFQDVVKVDCLAEMGGGTLYRVTMQNPPIIYLYQRLKLPLPLPLRIQAGYAHWEVVARAWEFEEVMKFARAYGHEPRVMSIRSHRLRDHVPLLSPTQTTLLTEAMAAGYFAVPRKINLTDLSRKLGRNKSTISENIALIEKKLLESALAPRELQSLGGYRGVPH